MQHAGVCLLCLGSVPWKWYLGWCNKYARACKLMSLSQGRLDLVLPLKYKIGPILQSHFSYCDVGERPDFAREHWTHPKWDYNRRILCKRESARRAHRLSQTFAVHRGTWWAIGLSCFPWDSVLDVLGDEKNHQLPRGDCWDMFALRCLWRFARLRVGSKKRLILPRMSVAPLQPNTKHHPITQSTLNAPTPCAIPHWTLRHSWVNCLQICISDVFWRSIAIIRTSSSLYRKF